MTDTDETERWAALDTLAQALMATAPDRMRRDMSLDAWLEEYGEELPRETYTAGQFLLSLY